MRCVRPAIARRAFFMLRCVGRPAALQKARRGRLSGCSCAAAAWGRFELYRVLFARLSAAGRRCTAKVSGVCEQGFRF